MLSLVLFTAGGFLAGVALTALVAFHVIGLIHADAVRICDSYGAITLFSAPGSKRITAMDATP